jgi:outer membrane protein TolC
MNNVNKLLNIFWLSAIVMQASHADMNTETILENRLTIYQVMQRVIDRYPSLRISDLEVEQAEQQRQQVESRLGWILNSTGGVTHDLTALGAPSDRLDITGSIARQLEQGGTLSLNGGYRYEDSTLVFNPAFPNPAQTTRLDLSYRLPLLQGDNNPIYSENLISADEGFKLAKANKLLTRITLAEKVKNLFYSAALTHASLINANEAVQRTRKLEEFINKNVTLGLAEEKDKLQIRAQLHSKLAELSAIQIQKKQQQTSLNRLMLEQWQQDVSPVLTLRDKEKQYVINDLIKRTKDSHPAIKIAQAKLSIAESQIRTAQDAKQDNLDLVMSVGSRTTDGKSKTATVSEKDWAGSMRIEYQHLFNDNGVSSIYKHALLAKSIALQNIQTTNDDIRYTVSGLVAEINAARLAVKTALQKLTSESLKLKEAEYRFRNGRTNTAQLIQFQNEYSFAQLAYQNQNIDLNNRIVALQIFTGQFWNELEILPMEPIVMGEEK